MKRSTLRRVAKMMLPAGSFRRKLAARTARKLHVLPVLPPDIQYAEWVERTEPFLWIDAETVNLAYKPLISIVVPVFNPPAKYLLPMVYSVVNQERYDNWELVLINASTSEEAARLTRECEKIDTRIKVVDIEENKGIAQNTNLGLKNCKGEYIALLDHDDILAPRALFEVAVALQDKNRPQIIYSDEDKITEKGTYRYDVHFKPDWSPQLFRQVNYLNHLMVMEKKLIDEVGGYREGYEGAQDYDLFLRLIDSKPTIKHIPKILYHWRAAHTSTASDISTKKHVLRAGELALRDHLIRNDQKGDVRAIEEQPGFYNIVYVNNQNTKAMVLLMPTENLDQYTSFAKHIISSLKDTSVKTDLILGPTLKGLKCKNKNISILKVDSANQKEYLRQSMETSNADTVVVFNAAAIPINNSWLDNLAGLVSQVTGIGVVSPILMEPSPSNKIFDAGYVKHDGGEIGLSKGYSLNKHTYFGNTLWSRNVDFSSGRVCAMRREIFEKYFDADNFYNPAQLINKQPYEKLHSDNLETVIYSYVKMEYRGELSPSLYKSNYYNQNLAMKFYEYGLTKNINVPPESK